MLGLVIRDVIVRWTASQEAVLSGSRAWNIVPIGKNGIDAAVVSNIFQPQEDDPDYVGDWLKPPSTYIKFALDPGVVHGW